jgi:mono/diheme cytochrome c family protein
MGTGRPVMAALGVLRLIAIVLWIPIEGAATAAAQTTAAQRGAYLTALGGCKFCHTDHKAKGAAYAGGAPVKTPFGVFHAPNITPDREHGIGGWSEADFIRAMRHGVAPDGAHYYPAFPYPAFTGISDADLKAMRAFLMTVTPVARPSRPHALDFPYSIRFGLTFWKWRYFSSGPYRVDGTKSVQWNRGAYLAEALVHCGECHTPRDALGGLDRRYWMAGTAHGPEGELVPNITPDRDTGVGVWSDDELATYLKSGMDPDGDFAGSLMADIIDNSTGRLNDRDLAAIVAYLRTIPPVSRRVTRQKRN